MGEVNTVEEPWHLRYCAGDRIPQAVLDFEASLTPPKPPTPGHLPALDEEEPMILYRDRRFNNVFRVGDSAIQIGEAVFLHDTAPTNPNRLDYIEDVHDESLVACMRSSKLTMAQMQPNGAAASFKPFIPPADLA